MQKIKYKFSTSSTDLFFDGKFSDLKKITEIRSSIIITDENVFAAHKEKLKGWNTIVLKAGEEFKVQQTVDAVIEQLIALEAGRNFTLVGMGGGVITDITGYIASIYMRGIRVGYVPSSLLGLVDASIGGKNGIDIGLYKNMAGTIRQPSFILHDLSLLRTLPQDEWINGFAEIIKHGCILNAAMFRELERNDISYYQKNQSALRALVKRNAVLKIKLVQKDEFEKGQRKILNFGHTLGHALENQYELLHGQAISIGMTYASHLSETLLGFSGKERLVRLLSKYGLPTYANFKTGKVFEVLKMDKKRLNREMNYVLLKAIGKAAIVPVKLQVVEKFLRNINK
jgi:3-dehydroquinate synthase